MKMNILVTVNDHYMYPLKIMIGSLFRHNQAHEITLYLMHSDVSEHNLDVLNRMVRHYGGTFVEKRMDGSVFEDAPCPAYFTKEMYYRILAPWLLPEVDKILYLDPDLIVQRDLGELYNTFMDDGICYAGAKDRYGYSRAVRRNPEIWKERIYINSGVLLCNLRELRIVSSQEEYFDYIREHEKELDFPDQDAINMVNLNRIRYVNEWYNLDPNNLHFYEFFPMMIPALGFLFKPYIIHYMGGPKPWNDEYDRMALEYFAREERIVNPKIGNKRKEAVKASRIAEIKHISCFKDMIRKRIMRLFYKNYV